MYKINNRVANNLVYKLDNLLKLEPGWDGYDAPRISPDAVEMAKQIAALLPGYDWQAVPCTSSAVQLEHHCYKMDIEIYVEARQCKKS